MSDERAKRAAEKWCSTIDLDTESDSLEGELAAVIEAEYADVIAERDRLEKQVEQWSSSMTPTHEQCICHRCINDKQIRAPGSRFLLSSTQMITCPKCGNKRCPHASDHRLECSGSNAVGQAGSIYQ